MALLKIGFERNYLDSSMFTEKSDSDIVIVLVYVGDILVTGSDLHGIVRLKSFLHQAFDINDLGKLKYFREIKIVNSSKGIFVSQRKYTLDLLKETEKLGAKPIDNQINPSFKVNHNQGYLVKDIG